MIIFVFLFRKLFMKNLLYCLCLIFIVISCKKEKTSWTTDWNTPLVHGNLTVNDLAFGNTVSENSEGFASIFFDKSVFSFSLDTLIKLKDTTLLHKTYSSIPTLSLSPGTVINTPGIDQVYDLGEIELKRVIVKEGVLKLKIESPWQGKTTLKMTLPKTKDKNGNYFEKIYDIPAASQSNMVVIDDIIDIADFDFDLTGTDGNLINNITADILVTSAEEVNSFTITNTDTVYISMEFSGLIPKYSKGYLGEYKLSDTTTISIPQLKNITSGQLNLDSINLDLSVNNGFKLLSQATIHILKGNNTKSNTSVELTFPLLNTTLNINTASGGLYNYIPSVYNLPIHSGNSNVLPFMENLPDSIDIGYTIHINPYGNSSGGNDESFPNSIFDLKLNGDFPLNFGLNALTLVDTFDIDFTQNETIQLDNGKIIIEYQNKFPVGAEAILLLLDETNTVLETITASSPIIAWQGNTSTDAIPEIQKTIFTIPQSSIDNLTKSKRIQLQISFSTYENNLVKLNMTDYFKFNLFSDLNLNIKL
jgi:hypothetical protein